jgi:hypothetical protein
MERTAILDEQVFKVIELLVQNIGQKIEKHGRGAYVSRHESFGIIAEEKHELMLALHSNDLSQFAQEAIDVAVACIWSVASMTAAAPTVAPFVEPASEVVEEEPQFTQQDEAAEEARRLMIERAAKSNIVIAQ